MDNFLLLFYLPSCIGVFSGFIDISYFLVDFFTYGFLYACNGNILNWFFSNREVSRSHITCIDDS